MNSETIEYLANLAKISFSKEEKDQIAHDLEKVISFVDQIQKVEIQETIETKHNLTNVFREDRVEPINSNQNLVEAAADTQDGFVRVPKIL